MDRRQVIAFALCFAVIVIFNQLVFAPYAKKRAEERKRAKEAEIRATRDASGLAAAGPEARDATALASDRALGPSADASAAQAAAAERALLSRLEAALGDATSIPLENEPLYRTFWSPRGGVLERLTYRPEVFLDVNRVNPLTLFHPVDGHATLALRELGGEDLSQRAWSIATIEGGIRLERPVGGGFRVAKVVKQVASRYGLEVEVQLTNDGSAARKFAYAITAAAGILQESIVRGSGRRGVWAYRKENYATNLEEQFTPDLIEKAHEDTGKPALVGLADKYFAAALAPDPSVPVARFRIEAVRDPAAEAHVAELERAGKLSAKEAKADRYNLVATIETEPVEVAPGATVAHKYLFYAGPRADEPLSGHKQYGMHKLLHYGWFGWLTEVFLLILHGLHRVVPNYGVGIIIMTLFVRGLMHPLSIRQQRSAIKMQKLKPEQDKIKAKYEGKKSQEAMRRMHEETMALYKKHGINPASGCLPLLIQFPIFIGLYNSFYYAIELRQAKFWWIKDLSMPDRLFDLPFTVPLLRTDEFNLLPLVAIAVMVVQQQMQPKSDDPQLAAQQKMMLYMSVFMGFIFYSVPAGLVLYFVTSSLVGLAEAKLTKWQLAREGH